MVGEEDIRGRVNFEKDGINKWKEEVREFVNGDRKQVTDILDNL